MVDFRKILDKEKRQMAQRKKGGAGGTNALAKYDEKLAAMAQQAVQTEKGVGTGNMISMRGGKMTYKGAEIPDNTIRAVVLDHVLHNLFYETAFDPNNPSAPDCYAYGRDEQEMAPHAEVKHPQNETCTGCPQNEWGTADRGRGKACGNKRKLALISEGDLEDIENAEIAYIIVPVTSVRAWAGYVRQLESTLHRPPLGVITEITCMPDPQTQLKVSFKMGETIDDAAVIEALIAKSEQAQGEIESVYVQIENAQPARGARGGRNARAAGAAQRNVVPSRRPAPRTAQQARGAAASAQPPARRSKF